MDDISLFGENLNISRLEELLRQTRNKNDNAEELEVLAVSPHRENVEFDKEFLIELEVSCL